jgi:hypothetical protein
MKHIIAESDLAEMERRLNYYMQNGISSEPNDFLEEFNRRSYSIYFGKKTVKRW